MAIKKNIADKIFLTGFMGAGKSTIGPLLAGLLHWRFLDLDTLITEAEGHTITEIFSDLGEKRFREIEKKMLKKVMKADNTVVSLGGGTLIDEGNLALVKEKGLLIWLKAELSSVSSRIDDLNERPLLVDDQSRIRKLYEKRLKGYQSADLIFDQNEVPEKLSLIIYEKLKKNYEIPI